MIKRYIDPDGRLHLENNRSFDVERNPESWAAWLELGQSFRLEGLHVEGYAVTLATLRAKHVQRGGLYWYASRRIAGDLRQVYVGRTEDLTLMALRTAAQHLSDQSQQKLSASKYS